MMLRVALPQLRPVTAVVVMLTLFESLKAFDLIPQRYHFLSTCLIKIF